NRVAAPLEAHGAAKYADRLDDAHRMAADRDHGAMVRPTPMAFAVDDERDRMVRGALQHLLRRDAGALGVVHDGKNAAGGGELALVAAGAGGGRPVGDAFSRRATGRERVRR